MQSVNLATGSKSRGVGLAGTAYAHVGLTVPYRAEGLKYPYLAGPIGRPDMRDRLFLDRCHSRRFLHLPVTAHVKKKQASEDVTCHKKDHLLTNQGYSLSSRSIPSAEMPTLRTNGIEDRAEQKQSTMAIGNAQTGFHRDSCAMYSVECAGTKFAFISPNAAQP